MENEIYQAREKSLVWMSTELQQENQIILDGFNIITNIVNQINIQLGLIEDGDLRAYAIVGAVTLAKASRFLLGMLDLALSGLSQESGALLRLFLECLEYLAYFREDETRIEEIIEDRLPSAGEVGKRIKSDFKELRQFLNNNASHFSYQKESIAHLITNKHEVIPVPIHTQSVFRQNIKIINALQIFLVKEGLRYFSSRNQVVTENSPLLYQTQDWYEKSITIFP